MSQELKQQLKQQLADYQDIVGPATGEFNEPLQFTSVPLKTLTSVRIINDDVYDQVVRSLAQAFLELNTIRARDGVPYTFTGRASDVAEEYFSSVVDGIDKAMIALTGKSAHCHPSLYMEMS